LTSKTISGATISGATQINTTGVVTAAAHFGTFEGTYNGEDVKCVTFIYPFMTSEATIRLPFNAMFTSVEVYCVGGTSAIGEVSNNAAQVGQATATAGNWAIDTTLTNTVYTANQNIRIFAPTVTGAVTSETVQFKYRRRP
jgi:hypothetical protein